MIAGIIFLAELRHSYSGYLSMQIETLGLLLTIWYNWATWKRMLGQTSNLNVLNLVMGGLIMLFGLLLITGGVLRIRIGQTLEEKYLKALIFLASTEILFGTTILLQTIRTIRLFGRKCSSLTGNNF